MVRRKRFQATVSYDDGPPRTMGVMAHTAEGARNCFESAGYSVFSVSAVKRRRTRGVGTPPKWQVDQRALESAMKKLGVTWKVRITRTSSRSKLGAHRLRYREPAHRPQHSITVDKLVSPTEATRILWHELAHAAQAERAAVQFARECGYEDASALNGRECLRAWREVDARSRRYSYKERPIEIEARYVSEVNSQYLLTKPA